MTYALMLAFFRNDMGFGGNNGLTDFKDILGLPLQSSGTRAALLVATIIAPSGSYLVARVLVTSAYGKVLVATRDAESRVRFLGYRVENFKLLAFTVSAVMAGIAGALYVPMIGIINPSEFRPEASIEAVVWVAVGGRGTLIGAVLGAVGVNYLKTIVTTGMLAPFWLFVLGGLFVAVTLALPKGLMSAGGTIRDLIKRRPAVSAAIPEAAE